MQGPILVIDDMPDMRALMLMTLGFVDSDVTAVESPEEAFAYLDRRIRNHNPPRIIISDVALKNRLDGWELAYQIRVAERSPGNSNAPAALVMLTGYSESDTDPAMVVRGDVDAVVEKPIADWDKFRRTLNTAYDKRYPDAIIKPQALRAPGQFGGSWFSNREMAVYAINAMIVLLLVWFVGRMDYQLSALTSNERLTELKVADIREKLSAKGLLNNLKEPEK